MTVVAISLARWESASRSVVHLEMESAREMPEYRPNLSLVHGTGFALTLVRDTSVNA